MRKYCNWRMETEALKKVFDRSLVQAGTVRIYTVLNHVSSSEMTRYISAYVPYIGDDGKPDIICIARERKVTGCGMDMGFHLAYNMFLEAGMDEKYPYQNYLCHSWL